LGFSAVSDLTYVKSAFRYRTGHLSMHQEAVMNNKIFGLVGAGCGLVAFLALGLLPAVLYGGYAGVLLAGGIFGTPIAPTLAVKALIVFGMVLGVTGIASLFAVGGAVVGSVLGVVTDKLDRKVPVKQ
jgi:hypothetical protein